MPFVRKSINHTHHLGPDLIELRERVGWDRKEASRQTKLTESFIASLEAEQWSEIGDLAYAERMLRSYVKFFGGNEKYFIEKYHQGLQELSLKREDNICVPRPAKVRFLDLTVGSRLIALIGFFVFVLVLGGYVYRETHGIFSAPPISIETPADGARLEQPLVQVLGKTSPESRVVVNGREAIVEPSGKFHLVLDIPRGTTMITVSARKRHSEEAVVTRHVVYDRQLPSLTGVSTTAVLP
ncbi:hypothetical protein FJZ48_00060 [Candidatus Uhrbacteria bacterium]|nr:hypothetical protein [Candidatus Uhrbacteria bacterium]